MRAARPPVFVSLTASRAMSQAQLFGKRLGRTTFAEAVWWV